MLFAADTEVGLRNAATLVNTADPESLDTVAGLAQHLAAHGFTFTSDGSPAELARVRALRPVLREAWTLVASRDDPAAAVSGLVNRLLDEARAHPHLVEHGDWGWHLHVTGPGDPLHHRLAAEAAMAFVDLVRSGELGRLRTCAAPDCAAVLVDLSRNRSKRFCDTGNCANRQHVAAYRARRAGA